MMAPGGLDPAWSVLTPAHLSEVATRAWQYVSEHASEQHPEELLANLAPLPPSELAYLETLAFVRSAAASNLVHSARQVLERLAQVAEPDRDLRLIPVGHIDWPATVVLAASSGFAGRFVTSLTDPQRDVPENRLLRFMLGWLKDGSTKILATKTLGESRSDWLRRVDEHRLAAGELFGDRLLDGVPAIASQAGLIACRTSRIPGYSYIADAYELYQQLTTLPSQEGLQRLFEVGVLVPRAESRVYELLVLFRLLTLYERVGFVATRVRMIGLGSGPVFTLRKGSTTITVYYQAAPFASRRYELIMHGAGHNAAARRPDILVTQHSESSSHVAIYEMKCSHDRHLISDAVLQLLGYHYDLDGLPDGTSTTLVAVTPVGGARTDSNWPAAAYEGDMRAWITDEDHLETVWAKTIA